ncbi:ribokinase [Listeria ivanovii]|uniref:ribokinase n=2 Tax=Listeria ivanovii TaxID=1638 RepID=UPI000DA9476C|nr:ribokinase [Listeria ivanovii]PZF91067.1 ribokinase [Listeria ivanovii]PZF96369.1 ribokinase [Listeria ivanovii]PZG06450.1 ribokinase [Listeria ivanovii]PZG11445.1 ribokinase [Listeria ivanovii]PZG28680.1 ribokinase [Listeria ivanovii]
MSRIVVLGSCSIDYVVETDRQPQTGETIEGIEFKKYFGGKGANQAVAAKRFGGDVAFVGAVGKDDAGTQILANFKKEGIQTNFVQQVDGATGAAVITIMNGDNSIIYVPGANHQFDIADFSKVFEGAKIVLLQLELPTEIIIQALTYYEANGITTILDPAPSDLFSAEMFEKANYITPNEMEFTEIAKKLHTTEKELLMENPQKIIISKGAQGVSYVDNGKQINIPAEKVEAVDSTGAGDTFTGVFAAMLAEESFEQAVKWAVKASAISVKSKGAQKGMPTRMVLK